MKKVLLCLSLIIMFAGYGQNAVSNGNFQTGTLESWLGFNNQVLTDNITTSLVGNVNNGEGSLYQTLTLEPNQTYTVAFSYRWVSGTSGFDMTVRAKDENSAAVFGSFTLNTIPDEWMYGSFTFTVPSDITSVRLVFYKVNGNRPLRIDNVNVSPSNSTSDLIDPETPINAQPVGIEGDWDLDFSDEFNGSEINTSKWMVSVSNSSRAPRANLGVDDWWWVEENAFLDQNGNLVLRGTKVDHNTMYCGSVESRNLYEPTYGFLEARIKIAETAKGNHTAFWLQGHNQSNVDNSASDGAEVDIFESAWITNTSKAVVHFDGYGPQRKNHTIPFNTPNLHSGYHIFGLHWTENEMYVYYDGVMVQSTNANKPFPFSVDPNGYPLVPQVPEWLWLSVGASFGDGDFQSQAVGTLSDALVDYVRVYKTSSTLSTEQNINQPKIRIYPNPAKDHINIDVQSSNYDLNIYNAEGRLLQNYRHSKSERIDISGFSEGMYFIQIVTADRVHSEKLIIK